MTTEPIVIERVFNAPVNKVWEAISDRDEMEKWYFDLSEFKPETGFEFSFVGGTEENKYTHLCQVTEAIPDRKLSYTWRYEGYAGISELSFELFPEGGKTKLILTHKGLETFPANQPDFSKENFVAGWTHIINISLKEFLEKGEA